MSYESKQTLARKLDIQTRKNELNQPDVHRSASSVAVSSDEIILDLSTPLCLLPAALTTYVGLLFMTGNPNRQGYTYA